MLCGRGTHAGNAVDDIARARVHRNVLECLGEVRLVALDASNLHLHELALAFKMPLHGSTSGGCCTYTSNASEVRDQRVLILCDSRLLVR